jgi:hypothetical protein
MMTGQHVRNDAAYDQACAEAGDDETRATLSPCRKFPAIRWTQEKVDVREAEIRSMQN